MAKRNSEWTEEKIARYLKEGRGSGELNTYKPWLTNQDFASSGRTHRVKGWKTNRMHQFFSDIERNYFYVLEWNDRVMDIREQFPLDREKTVQIASSKKIAHSIDQKNGTPLVMTTDFLLTVKGENGLQTVARTIKPAKKLNDERIIEKLEIERAYWENEGVDWGIVTELEIPTELWKNIELLHKQYEASEKDSTIIETLYQDLSQVRTGQLLVHLNRFDANYHLVRGTALRYFQHLLMRKRIGVNILEKINFRSELSNFHFSTDEGGKII